MELDDVVDEQNYALEIRKEISDFPVLDVVIVVSFVLIREMEPIGLDY